jgi:DNA repair photolyase
VSIRDIPKMDKVRRKSLLYKSGLGFWCVNHVQGCAHACKYPCYAYLMARQYGRAKDDADWCHPRLVENALELLERQLTRKRARIEVVHLCLTTDPFMVGYPEVTSLSLALIERLNAHGVRASVLTKGILPVELAGARFDRANTLGISLVSLDEDFRRRFEPGAAPYRERIAALESLHAAGCRTLVHIEPYPTPNIVRQEVGPLLEAVAFVDELYFGGWNYSPLPGALAEAETFYRSQGRIVRAFCEQHRIDATVGC